MIGKMRDRVWDIFINDKLRGPGVQLIDQFLGINGVL